MTAEWITAASGVVAATGVVFIAWQALLAAKQAKAFFAQFKADHERSRRQSAIELMQYWTDRVHDLLPALLVREMIEELNSTQCDKLHQRIPLSVEKRFLPLLETFFSAIPLVQQRALTVEDGVIKLDEFQARLILRHMTEYLNVLETIATAWRHNIVDRDIFEEEFRSLFLKSNNKFLLEEFRRSSGVYPSISAFVESVKNNKPKPLQKGPIG